MCCNLLSLTDNEIEQCTEKSRKLIEALKGPSDLDKKIDSLIKSDLNKSQIKKYIKEDVISALLGAGKISHPRTNQNNQYKPERKS